MVAVYLRLSKADGEEEESNSISSQREFLYQSLSRYGFSQEMVVEYVDDGYSGKNFDRPQIIRLFRDIERGMIQTILVKDLSRFGRNYHEVSEYLERKFPEAGVRFIAVNNGYDSKEQKDGISGMLQNIFYEYSSEESSKKIRQALFQRKKEGNYIASAVPYGYKKDQLQPYHLIVDNEAAEVVRLIFRMRCEGKSGAAIARYLNGRGIPSPRDYKSGKRGEHIWQSEVIWNMVRNRVYLGNLVAGKYSAIQTESQKQGWMLSEQQDIKMLQEGKENQRRRGMLSDQNVEDQGIEIEAVHVAIVNKEIFEQAQMAGKSGSQQKKQVEVKRLSYLKGMVICSGCGHRMKRKAQKKSFFFCKYYYYNQNPFCLKTGIWEETLLALIRQILARFGEFEENRIVQMYHKEYEKKREQRLEKERKLQKRRNLERYFLYEKWKAGVISREVYCQKKKEEGGRGNCAGAEGEERGQNRKQEVQVQGICAGVEGEEREDFEKMEDMAFLVGLFREIVEGVFVNSGGEIRIRFRIGGVMDINYR